MLTLFTPVRPTLALAIAMTLAACGGGGGTSSSNDGGVAVVTPTPNPTPSPEPSPTPTPTPTATTAGLGPLGSYIKSPTLDGAEPVHAGFDIKLGLTQTGIPGNYSDVKGAFRFVCAGTGKLASVDPIVYPGKSDQSHIHQAWGNTDFAADTTADSIRQNAVSDCNATPYSLNRSLYWMPALVNDQQQAIQPDLVVVYYKQWSSDSGPCTPGASNFIGKCVNLPNKIRFVFGWDMYNPTAKVKGATWVCGANKASNLDDLFALGCKEGDTLEANTMGPNCWDGKYLDTPDHRSHTAYAGYDNKGRYFCPSSHPYTIPQEENKVHWTVTADMYGTRADGTLYSRIRLESDEMLPGAKPGETLHADYMEGWIWEGKKMWYDNCIEKRLNCSSGVMGNGWKMVGAEMPEYGWKNPNPRVSLAEIK